MLNPKVPLYYQSSDDITHFTWYEWSTLKKKTHVVSKQIEICERNLWGKKKFSLQMWCDILRRGKITFLKGYFTAILCAFSLPFGVKIAEVWQLRLTRPIWFLLGRKYCSWQGKHFARIKCHRYKCSLKVSHDYSH